MMNSWVMDIFEMHKHYGFHDKVDELSADKLKAMLEFRIKFLQEELDEMKEATDAEDVVDALIDLVVVAIGTLDLYAIDADEAWNEVHKANMSKQVGIKESRPNPLGLPDLVKPEGWQAPCHEGNHGILYRVFETAPCEL